MISLMSTNLLKASVVVFVFLAVSLHLAFKGIFLSKFTINVKASSQLSTLESFYAVPSLARPNKPSKRLVLLLVDALKYSFIAHVPPENVTKNTNYSSNIFTVPYELARTKPGNALMYKSIADHPTTTSQRLKAIATGSIPTFIEIGQNLGTMRVTEDSFLYQLATNGKNVVFMGDDAWTSLHNRSLYLRAFPHDSFDIFDLEGVDLTVYEHFFEQFALKDWSVLLAHCTGLDHAGHAFGGNNREIERKLREMNSLASQIVEKLENDTVLLLFGDHGMLANGNHGGSDEEEVSTTLYAYSAKGFPSELLRGSEEHGVFWEAMMETPYANVKHPLNETEDVIKQVDMVASIARLMDVPIPHNNLGVIVPKLVMQDCTNYVECMHDLTVEFLVNAVQAYNFIEEYVKEDMGTSRNINRKYANEFKAQIMKYKDNFTHIILNQRLSVNSSSQLKHYFKTAIQIQTELNELLNANGDLFRVSWLEFNPLSAYLSCAILIIIVIGLLVKVVYSSAVRIKQPRHLSPGMSWKTIAGLSAILTLAFLLFPTLHFAVLALLLLLGTVWRHFGAIWNAHIWEFSGFGCSAIFVGIVALRIYTFFSDSLIYYEGKLILFLKGTFVVLLFILNKPSKNNISQSIAAAALLFFNTVSQFLIPVYERALSKVMNTTGIETTLEDNFPFLSILLPTLLMEAMFLYNISGKKHFTLPVKILYCTYKSFFITYLLLKTFHTDQTNWLLYIPRVMYIHIPLFLLLAFFLPSSSEPNWLFCSVLYSLQLILGTSVCPLGYLVLFLETFLFQKLSPRTQPLMRCLFAYLQSVSAFYITQHVPRFTHLQLFSGFVGFQKFYFGITPLLVYLNTVGPALLSISLFEACEKEDRAEAGKDKKREASEEGNTLSVVAILWLMQLLFMSAFVIVERENLHFADYMAPKFIFDVCISVSVAVYFLFKNL